MNNPRHGFTLVIMAAVLLLLGGLILATQPLDTTKELADNKKTQIKLKTIEKSLAVYYRINAAIPCPARTDYVPSDTNFGVQYATCAGSGNSDGIVENGTIRIGSVPNRTLNLPDDYAFDEWGNRFTYAVDSAGETITLSKMDSAGNLTALAPTIQDLQQKATNTAGTHSGVNVVVVSHGKNGVGAYNRSGSITYACAGDTASEYQNCNDDAAFIISNKNADSTHLYDDLITYYVHPPVYYLAIAHAGSPYVTIYNTSNWAKLPNPSSLPTTTAYGVAFSSSGTRLAVASSGILLGKVYNTSDFSELLSGSKPIISGVSGYTTSGIAYTPDGTRLALPHSNTSSTFYSNIFIMDVSGDPYTELNTYWNIGAPAPGNTNPGGGKGIAFWPADASQFVLAHNSVPYVSSYSFDGSDYVRVGYPSVSDRPTGAGKGVAFSPDGSKLAVAHATSPYVTIYDSNDLSNLVKLSNPATLPTGTGNGVAFSPDGALLAVAHNTSPYVTVYKTSDWSKVSNPATLPTGTGYGVAFSHDSSLLAVAHNTSPYVTIYSVAEAGGTYTLTKLADPTNLPTGTAYGIAFSPAIP